MGMCLPMIPMLHVGSSQALHLIINLSPREVHTLNSLGDKQPELCTSQTIRVLRLPIVNRVCRAFGSLANDEAIGEKSHSDANITSRLELLYLVNSNGRIDLI